MSNSHLIPWFDQLLFGLAPLASLLPVPPELTLLRSRLEAENITWPDIVDRGGLAAFPYQVHGDLNYLTDVLEKQWLEGVPPGPDPPPFRTRAVAKFWNELQCLLALRDKTALPDVPVPTLRDDEILADLLTLPRGHVSYAFESAAFWGEVARRFIHLRRPESASPLPSVSDRALRRLAHVYRLSSESRGYHADPYTLHLVHHTEHVNAAHWRTPHNLIRFMVDRPTHPLAQSIQALLQDTVNEVLRGEAPAALSHRCPQLDALLHNVRVIHESVEQVPPIPSKGDVPPKLIDVFQRLLALCREDGLWEREVPALPRSHACLGTSTFYLTEQLRLAEKEKRLWMERAREEDGGSVPEPSLHTCSYDLYARRKPPA